MKLAMKLAVFLLVPACVAGGSERPPSTRKMLVASAHAAAKEVESAWAEFRHANAMQEQLVNKLGREAAAERRAGNTTAAQATEAGAAHLKDIEGALNSHVENMQNLLNRTKPYIPDNLLQKKKRMLKRA
eukprot:TRINITY_DN4541_c0_g1_i1.p2 TRINITY_DN4541_c0_g1~~TRINITY_DN4541_c0_g1_i1.p2  ORF type:complete len:130 (-),score=35.31 TRINITY_DN4541_c0_g1_i1:111-500(-)